LEKQQLIDSLLLFFLGVYAPAYAGTLKKLKHMQ
jgi:hypothetical protein